MKESKHKNIKYPVKCYRLPTETVQAIERVRSKTNLSFNQLFLRLIKVYEEKNK